MLGSALTLALAIIASHGAPEDASPTELWAGHQISYGSQRIPFRNEVTTRMDAVVLARVTREHGRIVLEQEACRVWF